MTDLEKLAERVEREGPSRELDAEIAVSVLGMEREGNLFESADRTYVLERDYYALDGGPRELPAYTSSLDAAMTLVPEGCLWLRLDGKTMTIAIPGAGEKDWARHVDGVSSTPAAALCAAALRSKETRDEQ